MLGVRTVLRVGPVDTPSVPTGSVVEAFGLSSSVLATVGVSRGTRIFSYFLSHSS